MKKVILLLLLLLSSSLVVHEAQAARPLKIRNPMLQQENSLNARNEGGSRKVIIVSKDGEECSSSSSGRNRKLMTKTTSTSAPTSTTPSTKNIKKEGNKGDDLLKGQASSLGGKENFSVNSSPETGHQKTVSDQHYPDVLDLAGMDYSPAKRKPPIHN